jgi:signal transduction histidine kinase
MPAVLVRFGLKEALEDLFEDVAEKAALKTRFDISLPVRLSENKEFVIFRMAQELLHNTLKHSKADTVVFLLRRDEKTVFMHYRDNGTGFNTENQGKTDGIGLSGIRSRVEFLRGTCDLQSAPGKGFSVKITFPVS